MVDLDKLSSILSNLRGYLQKLTILGNLPESDFLDNFTNVESAKHLLQVSIECCLDIAHHIIADEGYRTPTDYYDSFVILQENGILPDEMMLTLRQMVSFRNRIVHLYWEIDDLALYHILHENLGDIEEYIQHILDFTKAIGSDSV
jgi:uncharacterized protein YutE (UPF0331/DUF86 family)